MIYRLQRKLVKVYGLLLMMESVKIYQILCIHVIVTHFIRLYSYDNRILCKPLISEIIF